MKTNILWNMPTINMTKNKKILLTLKNLFTTFFLLAFSFLYLGKNSYAQDFFSENFEPKNPEVDLSIQRDLVIVQELHSMDLDPHTASYDSEAQILCSIYEGLFSYDPVTLEPLPAIAESYKISRNKRRWTFTLRSDAKFSDGQTITAVEVKNSWLKLLSTKDALYASLFDIIVGAKDFREGKIDASEVGIFAKDDKTLVVQLNSPASHLTRILCHHAFSVKKESTFSGAYYISEKTDETITLLKNENYWDKNCCYIPKIIIKLSKNVESNTVEFNTGNIDWIKTAFLIDQIINRKSVQLSAEFGTQYLFFKVSNFPWNIADFRLALLTAVPWEEIRKGYLIKASTFIYPLINYPSVNGFSETDEDEALELIKEARKKYNIAENEKLSLTFDVMFIPSYLQLAALLKSAWEKLGVELVINEIPTSNYLNLIDYSNSDLFSYSWIGDFYDPLTFLELFRSNSTLNKSEYKNEKFDSLLDDAAKDTTDEHFSILSSAEQLLLDEGLILPISHPVSLNAINLQSIGGWTANSLDVHPFKYLYFKSNPLNLQNLVKR